MWIGGRGKGGGRIYSLALNTFGGVGFFPGEYRANASLTRVVNVELETGRDTSLDVCQR